MIVKIKNYVDIKIISVHINNVNIYLNKNVKVKF